MGIIKNVKRLIAFLIITGGIVLICYPSFASFINQQFANRDIADYDARMENTSEAKLKKDMQMAYDYNATLPGGYPADPFTGSNIRDFKGTEFEDFWMVKTGAMIGYVEVLSVDIYLPIYYGTSDKVLDKGAGLLEDTSLPVGGKGTHAVISAHTGMASKNLFTDIDQMKKGDLFFIHVLNRDFAYKVDQIKVVLPEETDDLLIEEGKDLVTLLTCTPFGVNDHRLLVRGQRTDYDFSKDSKDAVDPGVFLKHYLWLIVICAAAAAVSGIIIARQIRKRSGKNM